MVQPDGAERGAELPAVTRAGIAHLYFESIHPFEDGNGRLWRAVSEKALAQCLRRPTLAALAATILRHRKEYYAALEQASRGLEATRWLAWFAAIAIEAQRRTTARIEFLIDKSKLLDRLRGKLNERQEKALLRMLRDGPEGFHAGLSAANYNPSPGRRPRRRRAIWRRWWNCARCGGPGRGGTRGISSKSRSGRWAR